MSDPVLADVRERLVRIETLLEGHIALERRVRDLEQRAAWLAGGLALASALGVTGIAVALLRTAATVPG